MTVSGASDVVIEHGKFLPYNRLGIIVKNMSKVYPEREVNKFGTLRAKLYFLNNATQPKTLAGFNASKTRIFYVRDGIPL